MRAQRRDRVSNRLIIAFADTDEALSWWRDGFRETLGSNRGVRKAVIAGWAIEVVGVIKWSYGYFVIGSLPLIDWATHAPRWIADFLPNLESEIGMVLVLVGMVPIYWPPRS